MEPLPVCNVNSKAFRPPIMPASEAFTIPHWEYTTKRVFVDGGVGVPPPPPPVGVGVTGGVNVGVGPGVVGGVAVGGMVGVGVSPGPRQPGELSKLYLKPPG